MTPSRDVTGLLDEWTRGDAGALDRLLLLLYDELRRIAARQLRRERVGHTLQPTALVHEAYVRLIGQRRVDWRSRTHFYGVAARVMRRILVDHARRHNAGKRGKGFERVALEEALELEAAEHVPVLELEAVIARLEKIDRGLAHLVELRAFAGCTLEEAAEVLNVSHSTAKREWRTARAWLTRELQVKSAPD